MLNLPRSGQQPRQYRLVVIFKHHPHALCPMPYALCSLPHALCPTPHALFPMPHALCLLSNKPQQDPVSIAGCQRPWQPVA